MGRAIPLLQRNEAGTNKPPAKRGGQIIHMMDLDVTGFDTMNFIRPKYAILLSILDGHNTSRVSLTHTRYFASLIVFRG